MTIIIYFYNFILLFNDYINRHETNLLARHTDNHVQIHSVKKVQSNFTLYYLYYSLTNLITDFLKLSTTSVWSIFAAVLNS